MRIHEQEIGRPQSETASRRESPSAFTSEKRRQFWRALLLWCIFILLLILVNGTIPFVLGADLHAWTQSPVKSVLFSSVFYAFLFLAVPLVLIKAWDTVRRPAFAIPLCVAMLGITFWHYFWSGAALSVIVLAYLHRRFDLSDYGIRTRGWREDLIAMLVMGLLGLFPVLMQTSHSGISLGNAASAALTRLFANPASSVENLFYF